MGRTVLEDFYKDVRRMWGKCDCYISKNRLEAYDFTSNISFSSDHWVYCYWSLCALVEVKIVENGSDEEYLNCSKIFLRTMSESCDLNPIFSLLDTWLLASKRACEACEAWVNLDFSVKKVEIRSDEEQTNRSRAFLERCQQLEFSPVTTLNMFPE